MVSEAKINCILKKFFTNNTLKFVQLTGLIIIYRIDELANYNLL